VTPLLSRSVRHTIRILRIVGAFIVIGVIVAAALAVAGRAVPAQAAGASIWIQTLDSCKETLGGAQYNITDSSLNVNVTVTTPSASLQSVGGTCPAQRGNCSTITNGCVQVAGLPFNDTFHIKETATPPANSGNPLGFAPCNSGSACRSEVDDFTVNSTGAVSGSTTNLAPDGTQATYPSSGTFAATSADPILFHNFGLGSGSCDGDTDADDHLTGSPSSHCPYLPESSEASACQPYPWSCTLPGTTLHFALSTPTAPMAGVSFTETIIAEDTHNNTATSFSGSQTLMWSGPGRAPNGAFPLYPNNPVTFTSGAAKVSVRLVDAQTTSLTVSASNITGTLSALTVGGGVPSTFTVTAPTQAVAGTGFAVTLTAYDTYGNVATYAGGKTLTWTGPIASPNATAPIYPVNPVSFASGTATVQVSLVDAQATAITVTDGVTKGTSAGITVSTGSLNRFLLATPTTVTAGTAFAEPVSATDAYGNTVTSYAGTKTLTWSGPSNSPNATAPVYPPSVSFTSGAGSASIKLVDAQLTALTATQSSLTGTSATFSVAPLSASQFSVPKPLTVTAASSFTETITAIDIYGNAATGYSGAPTISGPHNAPSGTAPSYGAITFTGGVASVQVTLFDAETTSLIVSDSSINGSSASFAVAAAAAKTFTLSNPGTPTAGTAFNETLTAYDNYSNVATGYTGTPAVTWSGPSQSPNATAPVFPVSVSFTAGAATGSVTLYDAQSTTLSVTAGTVSGTSTTFTVAPAAAKTFTLANPGSQTAGTAFTETVTALDTYGNLATGYAGAQTLTWSPQTTSPNHTAPVYPASVTFTGGAGSASIKLVNAASNITLTATQATITGASTTFTVAPAAAKTFSLANPGTQTAGTAFTESVTALDAYGNLATGYAGAQTLAWSGPASSPNHTAPVYPASVTFTGGAGSTSIKLFNAASSNTLTATQATITGTSTAFTVGPSAAATFTLATPATQSAGAAFSEAVTAYDTYGNVATGYAGSPAVSGPHNAPNGASPTYGAVAFSNGVASVQITLFDAEVTSLTLSDSSISGASGSFTVAPAAAKTFSLANPGTQTAGTAFTESVTALDTYGNLATGYAGAQALTWSGPPSGPSKSPNNTPPSFPSTASFTAGVASSSITLYDAQTTGLSVSAGAINGASPTFTVNPASASRFSVAKPSAVAAGSPFNETVIALDGFGNTATGYTGTPTISGPHNAPGGTPPTYATVAFTNGVASVQITLFNTETTSLAVSDGSISGTSASFTVGPAPIASFSLTNPGPQVAGTSFTEAITAFDSYGNVASGYSGSHSLAWSGPSKSPSGAAPTYPTNPVTFSKGMATGTVTLFDAQTTLLTVNASGVSGTVTGLNVSGTTANAYAVTSPTPVVAGSPFTVTVTALDQYRNVATSYGGGNNLTWLGPSSSPNGTAPTYPTNPVNFSNGSASVSITLVDAQATTLSVTDQVIAGTSTKVTVTAPNTDHFGLATPATQTAGVAFPERLTALDVYGNTVTGYTGSQAVTWSGPSSSPNNSAPRYPASLSFTNGAAVGWITLFDAQTTSLTAATGSLTGTSWTFTVSPAAARTFALGNPGTQSAGAAFSETVTADDLFGNVATGYVGNPSLTWSGPSNSPNSTAPVYPVSVSFTAGVASGSITLYDAQTTKILVTDGSVKGTSPAFTVSPLATSALALKNPASATAGASFGEKVAAVDQYGNTTPSYAGAQTLTWSGPSHSPNNTAPRFPQSATNFTSGVATSFITLYDAESTSLTVGDGTFTGTSAPLTVNPASAKVFSLSSIGSATAGSTFTEPITALDAYGNTATSYNGTPTISGPHNSPNGSPPSYTGVTFGGGTTSAQITLVDAETVPLTVSDGAISGSTTAFTVGPAATASLSLGNPVGATAGAAFNESVTAVDTYGNTTPSYAGASTLQWSGPSNSPPPSNTAPLFPTGSTSFTAGAATASITLYDAQATTITVGDGTYSGTSPTLTVNPAAATTFSLPNPGTQTAGAAFTETVTAYDAYGNVATGYGGVPTFSGPSNSPNGTTPKYAAAVFTNGIAGVQITLVHAESPSLTLGDGTVSGTSGPFTVGPAATAGFSITNPGTQTAGVAFNETVTAVDTYGNTTPGYTGTQSISWSGPLISPNGTAPSYPSSVSFTNGIGVASITLFTAQSTTLTATQATLGGTSTAFSVNPGATASLAATLPLNATSAIPVTATASALDQWGNVATGDNSPLTVTSSDAAANLVSSNPSSVTLTSGSVTFSFTFETPGSQTITVSGESLTATSNTTNVS